MKRLRIAFVHPNLGLGGAERLTVDAARSLQDKGHKTTIFAARYDPKSAFEETLELDVRVIETGIPESLAGRFKAPASLLRMKRLARMLAKYRGDYDVVFCDLTAHIVPTLQEVLDAPTVFYCHYPDTLLTGRARSGLYSLYRKPIDDAERRGLEAADCVMVNSEFTAGKYGEEFPGAAAPRVVYPGVDTAAYADIDEIGEKDEIRVLSVNRFRASKSIDRAVGAMAALRERVAADTWQRTRLVLAGGYDETTPDTQETVTNLRKEVARLQLEDKVDWAMNPTETERLALLEGARCLLYTPSDEHFGLGPIEAMAAARPVVAMNSGGPRETVTDGVTGQLCEPDPPAIANALKPYLESVETARQHGLAGRARVAERFSLERFRDSLEEVLLESEPRTRRR